MKLSILRQSFLTALEVGGQVCGPTVLPITKMVKIKLDNGRIMVTSTNMDMFVSKRIEIDYTGETMEFCIELKSVVSLLKSIKDATVDIDIEDNRMLLKHQKGEVEIPIHQCDSFPMPKIEGDARNLTLGAEFFVTSLKRAVKFADKGKGIDRPAMRTVYYYLLGDKIKAVASDGLTLCSIRTDYNGDKDVFEGGIMIPSQAVPVLTSIIPMDGDIVIKDRERNFSISVDGCSVFVTKVDGKYPNVEYIIPKYHAKTTVSTKELLEAVSRCAIMANKASYMITLSVNNGIIDLKGEDKDFQTKSNEFILTKGDLDGLTICVSATLLIAILKEIDAPNVEIQASESTKPLLINAEGDEDMLFLLMPMKPQA